MEKIYLGIVAILLATTAVQAHGPAPPYVPLRRLLTNVARYVKAHPRDPQGYYLLGRLDYFAFTAPQPPKQTDATWNPEQIGVYDADGKALPTLFNGFESAPNAHRSPASPSSFARSAQEEVAFVRAAIGNLGRAIALRKATPGSAPGLYELCLACTFEDGARLATKVGPVVGIAPTATSIAWRERAIALYRQSFDAAIVAEREKGTTQTVAYEASGEWLRLTKARGQTATERSVAAAMEVDRKTLESRPYPVTPIVLALTPRAALADLLDDRACARVAFDLSGTGRSQRYGWVRPDTAFLVWDPDGTGKVTSGRQLFGSVTWWLFFADGYHALATLDDDGDGALRGAEMHGLALWFDRNQSGASDPGEVVPIAQTPIVELAVTATGRDGSAPMNRHGVRLRDGQVLPTWDWIATPR